MEDYKTAINETAIGELSLLIMDYADELGSIFDKIDAKFDELESCYKCDDFIKIKQLYYDNIHSNYANVRSNINNYSSDLIALVNSVKENESAAVKAFELLTDDLKSTSKYQ